MNSWLKRRLSQDTLNPPYYNQRKNDYVPNEFTESLESFNQAMKTAFKNCYDALKPRGVLALIMGPQQWKLEQGNWADHNFTLTTMALGLGFKEIYRIVSPLPTQQFTGYDVERAKKARKMLNQIRDIVILKSESHQKPLARRLRVTTKIGLLRVLLLELVASFDDEDVALDVLVWNDER